jgi:hypothetical protein
MISDPSGKGDRDDLFRAGPGAKQMCCRGPVPTQLAGSFRSPLHVKKLLSLVALVLTFLQTGLSVRAGETTVTESQIKAAFLLNFPKYVDWPVQVLASNAPLVIAVLGDDEVSGDLQKLAAGKTVFGHPIEFRRIAVAEEAERCHVLFIGITESRQVSEILNRFRNTSVLTVGQSDEFLEKGGIINFSRRDRKIRLEINLHGAGQANLKVSSKLLSVADSVKR